MKFEKDFNGVDPHELITSGRGTLLIAQAFDHFVKTTPDTSNREDMAFLLEALFPDHKAMYEGKDHTQWGRERPA